jgi:membrane protein implicated in regulation of membrane protease activity
MLDIKVSLWFMFPFFFVSRTTVINYIKLKWAGIWFEYSSGSFFFFLRQQIIYIKNKNKTQQRQPQRLKQKQTPVQDSNTKTRHTGHTSLASTQWNSSTKTATGDS